MGEPMAKMMHYNPEQDVETITIINGNVVNAEIRVYDIQMTHDDNILRTVMKLNTHKVVVESSKYSGHIGSPFELGLWDEPKVHLTKNCTPKQYIMVSCFNIILIAITYILTFSLQHVRFFVENLHLKPKKRGETDWMEKVKIWENDNNVPEEKKHNFDMETRIWMKDNEYEDTEMSPDYFFRDFLNPNGTFKFDEIKRMFIVSSYMMSFYIFVTNSLYFTQAVDFIGADNIHFFTNFLGKWVASKLTGKTTEEMRTQLCEQDWSENIRNMTLQDANDGTSESALKREVGNCFIVL
tara:strand:- start:681 stop:1568 length:888 start_codon:yes stop_codon:yes gene_type:complete